MKEDGSGDAMEGVRFARLMLTLALVAATTAAVRWLLTGHKKKVARAKSDATEAEACPGWQGAAGAGGRALETQGRPHSDTASQETDRHACCGTSSSLRVRQALPHDGSSSTESPDTRPQREEELPTNYPTGPQCPRKGTEAAAGVLGIGQCLRYEVRHPRGECSLDPASTAGLTSLGAHSLPPESRGRGLSRSPATDKAATGSDGNHIVQGQGSSESHYSSADPDTSFGAAHVHNGYVLLSCKGESCRAEGVQGETHSVDRGGHCQLQEYTHSPTLLCLVKESDITSRTAETSNSLPSQREAKEPQCTLGPSQVENSSQAVLAVSGSTVFAERIKAGASCADPAEDNLCTHSETGPGSIPEQHSECAASSCAKHLRKTDSTCLKVKCDNGTSETDLCRGDLTVANTMPSREGQRAQETISGGPAAEQGHPQTSLASSMVGLQGPPPGAGESPQQRQGSSISDENSPALTPGHASPHRATQQPQRTPVGRGSTGLVSAASDWAIQQPQRTPVGRGSTGLVSAASDWAIQQPQRTPVERGCAGLVPAASDWAIQQPQRTPVERGSAGRVPAASDWAIQQPQRTPVERGCAGLVPAASDWAIQQPQRTPVERGSAGRVPAASDWAIQQPPRTPVERGSAGLVPSALKELKPKRSVDPEGSGSMDPDIRGAGRHCGNSSFEHSGVMDSSPGGAQLNTKTSHYHGLNVERRNNDLELINVAAGLHPRHSTEKETAQGKPTRSQESVTAEVLEEQEFSTSHVHTSIPESRSTMSSQEMSTIDQLQHSTYEPSSLPALITSPTGSHTHREEDHGSADRSIVPTNTKTTHQSRERDYDFRERDYELGEQGQIRHLCPQVEHQVYGLTRRPAKTSICPTKDDEQVPVEHPHPELVLPNTTFDAQDFLESTSEVFRHELCNEADSPRNDRIDSRACTSPQQHESPRAQDQAALGSSQSPHEYEGKAEEEHSVNPSIMKEYCHSSNIKYGALHRTQVKQSDTEPVERGLVPARSDPLVFRLKATATAAMGAECANPEVSAGLAPLLKSRTSPYDYAVAKPITSTAVEEMFAQVSRVPHKNPTADHQPTLESVSVTGQSERTRDNVLSSSSRVKKCSDPGCFPVPDSLCSVADEKALPCMATLEADYTREAYVPYSRTDVCAAEPFNLPAVTDAALDSTPAQTNGHSGEKRKAEVADQDIPQIKNTYLMENAHTHIYNVCFQDNFPTTSKCNSHLSARDVMQDPAQEQPKEILVPTLFAAAHKSTVQGDDCESSNIGRKDANTMSDSETEVIVVSNGSQVAGLCNGGHTSSLEPVCAENSRATLRNPEVQSQGKTVRPEEAPNKQLGLSPKYTVESEHSESLIEPYKVPTRPASHSKNGSCTQDVEDDFEIETIPDRVHSFNYFPYVSDSGRYPDSESSESGYTTENTITPAFEERSWSSLGTEGDQLETSCLDLLVTLPRATAISESTSKAADQQKTTESTVNNNINVDHLERTNHKNRVNMMDCTTLPLTLNYTHAFESRCMPSEEPNLNFDQSVRVKPNDFNSEDKQSCQSPPTENVISCSNADSESMIYDMSSYGTGVVEKASDQCFELNETPSPPKTAVEAESISTDESAGVCHGQRTVEGKRKKRTGIAGAGIIRSMHPIDDNMHSDMCAARYLGIVVQTNRKTENTNKSGSDKQICTTQTQDIFSQSTVPQRVHISESTTNRDVDYTIPGESSLSIQNNPSSSHDALRAPSTKSPGLLSSKQTHDLSESSSQTMSLNIRSDQRTEGKELLEIKEPDEDNKSFLLDSTVVDSYRSGYCQTKDMAKMTNIFRDNEIKNSKYFRHTTTPSPPRAPSSPLPSTSTCQRYCTQQLQSSYIQLHSNARIDRTKESERQNSHNNNLLKPFNINTQMEMPPRRSVLQRRGSISKIAENPELRICSAHITSPKTKLPLAKSCEDILSDTPAKNVYSRSKTRSMLCLLTEHYSLPLAKNQKCPVEHVAKGSFLNIPETLQFTEDAVKMQLHLGNCLELLKFAKKNGANNIQEAAYTVMSDNYLQVMRDPTIYSQLSGGERDRILQRRTRGKTVMGVAELETIYGLKKTIQNSSWQAVNEVPPESPCTDPQQRAWLYTFDIEKNSWQPLTQVPEEANLKGCSICSMNNYLFLAGGIKGQGKDAVCSNKVFCYNPLTDIWQQICPMNQARSQLKLVPLDGYLYAIGGECLYTVERYDPRLDKWTFKASLPKGSFAVAHEAASCSGEIYVSGGNLFYRLFKYSPLKDLWEECPYNTSRKRSCDMVAIRSFIYRFDIHRDSGVSVFKYNITTKVWNECATMPLSNPLPFRCAVLDGTVYCLNKNMTVRFTADDGSHRFEQGTLRPFTGGGRGTLCPFVLTIPQPASLQTSV